MRKYAFLGGAFDPIHWGHIKPVLKLQQLLKFNAIHLLPYNLSPTGKQPQASAAHRRQMTELALAPYDYIAVNETDLNKNTPAYTYNTLKQLRRDYGDAAHFSFILGDDCYAKINTWQHWEGLYALTNFVVTAREGAELSPPLAEREQQQRVMDASQIHDFLAQTSGCILKVDTPVYPISSTAIRDKFTQGQDYDLPELLPEPVIDYINQHQLYS